MNMLKKILQWFSDDCFLKVDGFDDAIIGIDDTSMRLIYSVSKCIDILIESGMTQEDALDVFHYEIKAYWFSQNPPIWCTDDL
jgi:hypothetical protein